MPLSNLPDGMSRLDLQHVGEIDWDDDIDPDDTEYHESPNDPDADEVEADADDSWADE